MTRLLAAILALCPALTRAATPAFVRRGELVFRVHLTGTVVPADVFRLKSNIEGRVESVTASSFTWMTPDKTLATLAHRELAAMLDADRVVGQQEDLAEERWGKAYRPTPIKCPETCYVLKIFAKPKIWMKPQALMFEAARSLKMVGRVRPEDARHVNNGMDFAFWPVRDPSRRLYGRIARYVIDVPGENATPGASFSLTMGPDRYFPPGTEWEGELIYQKISDVLLVPTAALIEHEGAVYLPVRVSTGPTVAGVTQIAGGVEERRNYLILNDQELNGTERLDLPEEPLAAPGAAPATAAPKRAAPVLPANTDVWEPPVPGAEDPRARNKKTGKAYGGEDPYGGQ